MVFADKGFEPTIVFGSGLDNDRNLPIFVQCALPAIEGLAGRQDVDACGQAFLHQEARQPPGGVLIG